jgi:N-acetylglucosaminyldiphosphoundecaprenol N-acetyl-beta-D-mannosaminyltransferase
MSTFSIFGVEVTDLAFEDALGLMTEMIEGDETKTLFYVNAHTLNCASADPSYRDVLNAADLVFGDGTGVRWAAKLRGTRVKANLNGTDLTPALLDATAGRGFRYYLLGGEEDTIERAAARCTERFAGWELAGYHHGYVLDGPVEPVLEHIARAKPHLLLVGMGNPLQERWIHEHRDRLDVPLVAGVGGLFDYWAGDLDRAPRWMRRAGIEWVHVLLRQPSKARRYLLGNPLYLYRVARELLLTEGG